jgi:hypothetical protein
MLHAPCVTMPLIAVGGMPVGVQLMGQQHEDARITALARWMLGAITPVVGLLSPRVAGRALSGRTAAWIRFSCTD